LHTVYFNHVTTNTITEPIVPICKRA